MSIELLVALLASGGGAGLVVAVLAALEPVRSRPRRALDERPRPIV